MNFKIEIWIIIGILEDVRLVFMRRIWEGVKERKKFI